MAQADTFAPNYPEGEESAFSEGVRLRAEGVGLSNLWGDVSERNFADFDDVLRGFTGDAFVLTEQGLKKWTLTRRKQSIRIWYWVRNGKTFPTLNRAVPAGGQSAPSRWNTLKKVTTPMPIGKAVAGTRLAFSLA